MKSYSTNLSDSQWNLIDGILNDKRPRKYEVRQIFNDIFYLIKTGCQWHVLPFCFPPRQIVNYYFLVLKHKSVIDEIHKHLRDKVRMNAGNDKLTSLGLIDSQFHKNNPQ